MADDTQVEIIFPFKGYSSFWGFCKQEPLTAPIILNCRDRDSLSNQKRGGQRPGKSKVTESSFTENRPILKIIQCGTTYIPVQE
jgi:hypothetical protein